MANFGDILSNTSIGASAGDITDNIGTGSAAGDLNGVSGSDGVNLAKLEENLSTLAATINDLRAALIASGIIS